MITCMIDSKEDREVATEYIIGDLLQAYDISGSTHLKFDGMMAKLLAHIDTDICRNYTITDEKGRKIIYYECLKALYGTLDVALLFLVKLSTDTERWGFKINRYDFCFMNNDNEGEKCTILWHVDNIKTSHKDKKV